jgi:two-component system phosphate regulon sensor histidine kinase PhoR
MFISGLGLFLAIAVAWVLLLLLGLNQGWIWGLVTACATLVWWTLFDQHRQRFETFVTSPNVDKLRAVKGLWHDLAERTYKVLRQKDQSIQKREQRLEEFLGAIQASPNGVMLLDPEGRIDWCNRMASEHMGIDPIRDLQQYIQNMVRHPAFAEYMRSKKFDSEVMIPGPSFTAHEEGLTHIAVRIRTYDRKGRMLMISSDMSAIKRAEAMRRDFVANVSHEVRTPLTVIRGFIETLQSLELSESERRHYLDLMGQQAGRMEAVVSDLLTLSRLEGSPVPGFETWQNAKSMLVEVMMDAKALSSVVHPDGQVLEMMPMPPSILGMQLAVQAKELSSAMANLLTNAVRYTPSGGSIKAGWQLLENGDAEYFVEDTGPGIGAEHIPRLTERFYRVDRSRSRETGGTGLGLAIVKHVAQRLGGDLMIQSALGKGSRFSIRIPSRRVRTQDDQRL